MDNKFKKMLPPALTKFLLEKLYVKCSKVVKSKAQILFMMTNIFWKNPWYPSKKYNDKRYIL